MADQLTVTPKDLDREIDRARRGDGVLAVAHVEVVGVKPVGAADGDRTDETLLLRVVGAIQNHLRSYDLVMHLGGESLLCVMSGATISDAVVRFAGIQDVLADDPNPCEIRVGVAALTPEDTAADLMTRAVAKLVS